VARSKTTFWVLSEDRERMDGLDACKGPNKAFYSPEIQPAKEKGFSSALAKNCPDTGSGPRKQTPETGAWLPLTRGMGAGEVEQALQYKSF